MASAEKRGSTWRCRYVKPDGTYGSGAGSPPSAQRWRGSKEQEAAIRAGRWVDPDLRAVTFGEFTKSFMTSRRKRGRTVGTRWEKLDSHILPRWQDTALGSVTWYEVDAWQQSLTIADVSRGHCVSLMSSILTAAVDAQHITVNPPVRPAPHPRYRR